MKRTLKLITLFALTSAITMAGNFVPGTYRASEGTTHSQGFDYTNFATMIVNEAGDIEELIIDATFPIDSRDLSKGYSTKQVLGDDYGMRIASEIDAEWDEQADALAANIIENQGITFEVNEDKTTDGVAGATMKVTSYVSIIEDLLTQATK